MTTQLTTATENRSAVSTQALVFDAQTVGNMQRMAEMMAAAKVTVPKHLAGNPGDCLAIIMQAAQFQMNPFAVAQKTHLVNGQLGYEGQLINAVVQNSGAIRGRFHYEYRGEGANIECRVGAVPAGETDIQWGEWLSAASVQTKNSPLWKTNPKQQLGYLQVKNWARQYAPGAILGVYSVDELQDHAPIKHMGNVHRVPDPVPAAAPQAPPASEPEPVSEDRKLLHDSARSAAQRVGRDAAQAALQSAGYASTRDVPDDAIPAVVDILDALEAPAEAA